VPRHLPRHLLVVLSLFAVACDDAPSGVDDPNDGGPDVGKGDHTNIPADWTARVESMALHIDVGDMTGLAVIQLEPGPAKRVSLEAGGLDIVEVSDDGGPIPWQKRAGALHVEHAANGGPFYVEYGFDVIGKSQGYGKNGSTVLWPYYCGNLFPCRSGPDDGITFDLSVAGFPASKVAIYPEVLAAEAPSYTLAFAIGAYTCQELGRTQAKTSVSVCWLPRGKTAALEGSKHLVKAFDWLEKNIGRYTFGPAVASVAVSWGKSAAGGMEHHPYWHVATSEMSLPITHVHEAVHGWFGTGVRMACWEDFVLSEGTTTYLAARALGAVTSKTFEKQLWADYKDELLLALEDEDIIVWPDTCGQVDILADGLFSNLVYMKGAFFWKAVAERVGPTTLDAVLARFYERWVGKAARFSDLMAQLRADTGFDPTPLVDHWLRSPGDPF